MVPESRLPYLNKPMHLSLTESTFGVICWVSDTVLGMGDTQTNMLGVSASRSSRLVGKRDIKLSNYEPIYVECYKRGKNQIVWKHRVLWNPYACTPFNQALLSIKRWIHLRRQNKCLRPLYSLYHHPTSVAHTSTGHLQVSWCPLEK